MSSDAEIIVYAKRKLSRTNKERFVPIMNSGSDGFYDVGGPLLPDFLRGYPHPKRKWEPYELREITLDEIQAYVKASRIIVEMQDPIIPDNIWYDIDLDNEEYKKLFDKICELFYVDDDDTKDWLKAMAYKLDCIKHDLPFFEEILYQAHIHETKGEEIYITLDYL